jgi:hypothetical protein
MSPFDGEKSALIPEVIHMSGVCRRLRANLEAVIEATLDLRRAWSQVSDVMREGNAGFVGVGGLMADFVGHEACGKFEIRNSKFPPTSDFGAAGETNPNIQIRRAVDGRDP